MAGKVLTAADIFYSVTDVQRLLGYSQSRAYKVIAELNREMQDAGYCTCRGKISRRYLEERYCIAAEEKRSRSQS